MSPQVLCIVAPEPSYVTLVTAMFMHGDWVALLTNLWFLAVFGDNVEDVTGHLRFGAFYLTCGVAAAALALAMTPVSAVPIVGAAGAISGVMGGYLEMHPLSSEPALVFLGPHAKKLALPAYVMLAIWVLLNILAGWSAIGDVEHGAVYWANVGGFLAGLMLVRFFGKRDGRRRTG